MKTLPYFVFIDFSGAILGTLVYMLYNEIFLNK